MWVLPRGPDLAPRTPRGRLAAELRAAAAARFPPGRASPPASARRSPGQPEQHGLRLVVPGVPEEHGSPAPSRADASDSAAYRPPGRRLGPSRGADRNGQRLREAERQTGARAATTSSARSGIRPADRDPRSAAPAGDSSAGAVETQRGGQRQGVGSAGARDQHQVTRFQVTQCVSYGTADVGDRGCGPIPPLSGPEPALRRLPPLAARAGPGRRRPPEGGSAGGAAGSRKSRYADTLAIQRLGSDLLLVRKGLRGGPDLVEAVHSRAVDDRRTKAGPSAYCFILRSTPSSPRIMRSRRGRPRAGVGIGANVVDRGDDLRARPHP